MNKLMQPLPLGDALFTATQQKVLGDRTQLGLLYGKPDQSFYANEIARWAQIGKGRHRRSPPMSSKDNRESRMKLNLNIQPFQTYAVESLAV